MAVGVPLRRERLRHVAIAELSLLEDVKALAARLLRKGKAIAVLVNNAGAQP